jgi:hypothetical protein
MSFLPPLHRRCAPKEDPQITTTYFTRSAEDDEFLGLAQADVNGDAAEEEPHLTTKEPEDDCNAVSAPCSVRN